MKNTKLRRLLTCYLVVAVTLVVLHCTGVVVWYLGAGPGLG